MSVRRTIPILLALGLLLFAIPGSVAAQTTGQLSMQSASGDYIGQGRTYNYTSASGAFTATTATGGGQVNYLQVAYVEPGYTHWWYLYFSTQSLGIPLTPGYYPSAQRWPFETAGHPGLSVSGDGRGCNTLNGEFTVTEAVYDYSVSPPRVVRFVASFIQHCEGSMPPLTGTIVVNGDPLPTATASATPTNTPTDTPSPTNTATSVPTDTPSPTSTATATPTNSATTTPSSTAIAGATSTASVPTTTPAVMLSPTVPAATVTSTQTATPTTIPAPTASAVAPTSTPTLRDPNRQPKRANVVVVQRADSHPFVRPGDVVTLTIVATNRGKGGARNATITVPFDPSLLQLLDARLSRSAAWVSKLRPDTLIIQTGGLSAGGDAITATVRFQVRPQVAIATPLAIRLTYTWRDDSQIGFGRSNVLSMITDTESVDQPQYPMLVSTIDRPGDHAPALGVFTSPIFAPFEPVAFWYITPTGQTIAVGTVMADANGQVTLEFNPIGLTPGAYTMVAHGNWTDFIATAPFQAP